MTIKSDMFRHYDKNNDSNKPKQRHVYVHLGIEVSA